MFYDRLQAIKACEEDPSLIFELMKDNYFDIVEEIISKNKISINTCDNIGNNIMMKLLKYKKYDLVLKFMSKRDLDINHQNDDGNTFGHILALDNTSHSLNIWISLTKKKKYIPNIKNNNGETALDRCINSNSIAALKILSNKKFDNIDVISFKKLINTYINNGYYGKYSKLNNLEIIIDSLEKDLLPVLKTVIDKIVENMDLIKKAIMKNNDFVLNNIINSSLLEATV